MKTIYIDCGMGAAGDMLTAALVELMNNPHKIVNELNLIGIPAVKYEMTKSEKLGVTGTHISVTINGVEECEEVLSEHHHGSGMHHISHIINELNISDKVKSDALNVYNIIAKAESEVHGVPVTDIHFHEVGTMDAVADVVAVCWLMDKLGAERIIASPINTGSGMVKCAHGILPVPAPATANILDGVPSYSDEIKGELCTPTGAALVTYFASDYCEAPEIKNIRAGYGMGNKDFPRPNCVRIYMGETE